MPVIVEISRMLAPSYRFFAKSSADSRRIRASFRSKLRPCFNRPPLQVTERPLCAPTLLLTEPRVVPTPAALGTMLQAFRTNVRISKLYPIATLEQ
jgi:hypothetical protein